MRFFHFIAVLCLLVLSAMPASAQRSGFNVIRDVEIEDILKADGTPVWRAAGIPPESIRVVIINDSTLNAFVAGGMNIFFHTGLLQATDTPEQLIGVIAHETGHIAGGHLVRGSGAMKDASAEAILTMVLGVGAAVLSGDPKAGAAVITGGQQIAQRNILSFSRAQESSADAAGMRFLDNAKLSSSGLLEFLEKLSGQELLPVDRQVEFVRTHPLTRDRMDAVRYHVEQSPLKDARAGPDFTERHERMKAKLLGYLKPEAALLRYGEKDARLPARYARAIALYRKGEVDKSLAMIDQLIKEEPNNPYFYELKGQVLFENARVREAIPAYKKAIDLLPGAGLIHAAYAHALLETQDPGLLEQAITRLNQSLRTEPREPSTWRLLATAWGRKQDDGMVAYCLAEEALTRGDRKGAHKLAERAVKLLPKGSPYALRALDIKQEKVDDNDDE
jgi:predicted Zn-dependent protease